MENRATTLLDKYQLDKASPSQTDDIKDTNLIEWLPNNIPNDDGVLLFMVILGSIT